MLRPGIGSAVLGRLELGRPSGAAASRLSVAASSWPPHFAFADGRRSARRTYRRTLEKLVPVLFTDQAASQEVVSVPRDQLRTAL